ncbi:MAG: transcriptional repressor [Bacteroidales bacterium]|nr:transcriptional repressor [Bacteroidales bacterium]
MIEDIQIKKKITEAGLKVTPQRLTVLKALHEMNNHPSADQVLEYIRRHNPHMGTGTVYNILEVFADKGIIHRVKTEKGILRYDAISETHHHLYCSDTEKIEDYYDKELSQLLEDYFSKRRIQGFDIEELKLQIIGKYNTNRKN